MGIKANFSMEDVRKSVSMKVKAVIDAAIDAMCQLGSECAEYARNTDGFEDETGNLRSSIGYKVFVDGVCVAEDYVQILDGSEGMAKGRALADTVGEKCGDGQIMLVVTAGEEYAIFLESNGFDVLTSSEMFARQQWSGMKQRIDEMIRRAAA